MMSAMSSKIRAITAVAVLALGAAGGAQAATVALVDSSTNSVGNTANIFGAGYGAYTPANAVWGEDPTVVAPPGSVQGVYKSPFARTPLADKQSYFSTGKVSGTNGSLSPNSLTFASAQKSIKLLWGSIDSYNKIEFLSGGGTVYTMGGTDLINMFGLPGSAETYDQVALVKFSDFGVNGFDKIVFTSTKAAMEFALPAAVPVPAAGLLLLSALGGIAVMRRRKAA